MPLTTTRRAFLQTAAGSAALATTWLGGRAPLGYAAELPVRGEIPPLATISGKPKERGREYGRQFQAGIRHFLQKEIFDSFVQKPSPKDEMLRYAAACGEVVREVCPIIYDELQGIAEGAELPLEQVTLITLHEELFHRGVLPKVPHCTAVAVGPPSTSDGKTYVGQTWDWMESVFGMSSMVQWRRTEGPSVLAYGFPGLWVGAGLNSAGLALTWTSADLGSKTLGARVGVPAYVLLTHLLYQEDLASAIKEAQRDRHAGWFTFVLGDGEGNLVNIEGSPKGIAVERVKGRLTRVGFGSRQMTGVSDDKPVTWHPRCQKMYDLLEGNANDRQRLQGYFADPKCGISGGKGTIDMMVFDTTDKVAYLSRGPSYNVAWKEFRFGETK